jgi:hypothetical protein
VSGIRSASGARYSSIASSRLTTIITVLAGIVCITTLHILIGLVFVVIRLFALALVQITIAPTFVLVLTLHRRPCPPAGPRRAHRALGGVRIRRSRIEQRKLAARLVHLVLGVLPQLFEARVR